MPAQKAVCPNLKITAAQRQVGLISNPQLPEAVLLGTASGKGPQRRPKVANGCLESKQNPKLFVLGFVRRKVTLQGLFFYFFIL